MNAVLRGAVTHMDASTRGRRVICAGSVHAEARVLDLDTNTCIHTLEHTEEVGKVLDGVVISPCGTYAVTRFQNGDIPDYLKPWRLLKEDKIWDLASGECVFSLASSRFVVFSPIDDKVVFFQCRSYSTYDWSIVAYDLVVFLTDGTHKGESYCIGLPEGNVIGDPLITGSGKYLCALMQLKEKSSTGTKSSAVLKKRTSVLSGTDNPALVLVVYSFEKMWRGLKYLELSDIWNCFNEDDRFMDLRLFHEDTVLITYGKRSGFYQHREDGILDRSKLLHKGAFQYDVLRDNIAQRYDNLLSPNSRVDQLIQSQACSFIMDGSGQVFNTVDNEHTNTIDLKCVAQIQPVFVLDGTYLAMLKESRRELIIVRSNDGVQKARVFIHGIALHIKKARDDRTLVIGCQDGRIMTFTVILETSDAIVEIVNLLPSRVVSHAVPQIIMNGDMDTNHGESNANFMKRLSQGIAPSLKQDIRNIQTTQNMQKRLSTITRAEIAEQKRKTSTFKAVGEAVALTQELKKVTTSSAACSIQ